MSRRFHFRLQPVLELRERTEQQHQRRVAEIDTERLAHEQTLRGIQAELAQARESLRSRLKSPSADADVSEGFAGVRLQANAALHCSLRAQRAAIELAGTLRRLDAARAELMKASADRKAVQMLKDKRRAEHAAADRKREASDLDELMVMRLGMSAQLLGVSSPSEGQHP